MRYQRIGRSLWLSWACSFSKSSSLYQEVVGLILKIEAGTEGETEPPAQGKLGLNRAQMLHARTTEGCYVLQDQSLIGPSEAASGWQFTRSFFLFLLFSLDFYLKGGRQLATFPVVGVLELVWVPFGVERFPLSCKATCSVTAPCMSCYYPVTWPDRSSTKYLKPAWSNQQENKAPELCEPCNQETHLSNSYCKRSLKDSLKLHYFQMLSRSLSSCIVGGGCV